MSAALALAALALLAWPGRSAAAARAAGLAASGRLAHLQAPEGMPSAAVEAPARARRLRRGPRGAAVDDGLLRAIGLLAQELRGGADPARAWASAADAGAPTARWMLDVARAAAAGQPIGAAVIAAAQATGLGATRAAAAIGRLGAAWACGAGSGASAADMLDQWLADARARRRLDAEIDSQLAGPRASTALLAALPLLGLGLGAAMGANPVGLLLGSAAGATLLAVGATLETAGILWVRRIIATARSA